jgi:hypothetical protein
MLKLVWIVSSISPTDAVGETLPSIPVESPMGVFPLFRRFLLGVVVVIVEEVECMRRRDIDDVRAFGRVEEEARIDEIVEFP